VARLNRLGARRGGGCFLTIRGVAAGRSSLRAIDSLLVGRRRSPGAQVASILLVGARDDARCALGPDFGASLQGRTADLVGGTPTPLPRHRGTQASAVGPSGRGYEWTPAPRWQASIDAATVGRRLRSC